MVHTADEINYKSTITAEYQKVTHDHTTNQTIFESVILKQETLLQFRKRDKFTYKDIWFRVVRPEKIKNNNRKKIEIHLTTHEIVFEEYGITRSMEFKITFPL
jgi:hypothetical protein